LGRTLEASSLNDPLDVSERYSNAASADAELGSDLKADLLQEAEIIDADPPVELEADRETQATKIVAMVRAAGCALFHDDGQRPFAMFNRDGHREVWPLRSRTFKHFVRRLYFKAHDSTPAAQSLTDALAMLEATALFDGEEHVVHLRIAGREDSIYLDLCDRDWRVIEITPAGWSLLGEAPVRFRRADGMKPLPLPERGGRIEDLHPFLNVAGEDDFRLLVAWLLSAYRPGVPYPVLATHGEQGSAKSTAGRILRELIDPNKADLRRAARETRDLMIAANNGWVVTLDNLSHITQGLSDDLCRLATGGGFSTRQLYTDEDEIIFEVRRPVLLNGIEEVATSGDLLDRILMVKLPKIEEHDRREETEIWAAFEKARPLILGAVLDALVAALGNLPATRLERLPRMADMARWITAAESGLGWEPGSFMDSYYGNRAQAHALAVDSAIIGPPLLTVIGTVGFEGSGTELLAQLNLVADEKLLKDRDWPKTARGLRGRIDRLAPSLRALGHEVDLDRREADTGRRVWWIR
jgi:hypothetical protein